MLVFIQELVLPKRVFKSVVGSARVDKVARAELFNESKALELWCVDDSHTQWVELDVTVDRVIEHLKQTFSTFSGMP